ncbi:MAG TPA: TonB-dependent receptor [Polyangiaceae bacterium]|nr:TonB-dependent receptor [Polyangiaceae bacterium]
MRLVTHSCFGSGVWFSAIGLYSGVAAAEEATSLAIAPTEQAASEEAPQAPPPDVVHEVTVRGNKADALKRASGSGTTIGEREIKNAQPESTGELLRRVPGLQLRTEDPMGLRLNLGVRGLSPTRSRLILMEEDGVPVVVSPYGEPELYYTPIVERIQRLDVLKGSDVLRYGPQTVGAVVQLHTFEPTMKPAWYVASQVGSQAYGAVQARYSGTTGDVGYVAQIVRKSGDGYRNMGFYATDAFGKAVLTNAAVGQLSFKFGFHDDHARTSYLGLTDAMWRADPRQDTVAPYDYFDVRRYEASLVHEKHFNDQTALRSTLFGYQMQLGQRSQDFDRNDLGAEYISVPDPNALFLKSTSSLRDRTYDVLGLSSELEHRFQTAHWVHRLKVGARAMLDVARRKLSAADTLTAESGRLLTDDTTNILGLAAWFEDQISITNKLLVTPAFRYEHSNSRQSFHVANDDHPGRAGTTVATSAGGAMPGLGVIYGTPKLNAFTSAYLGYSAPRISQAITPQGQDSNLSAERSRNYELGLRGRGQWLRAEANSFLIQFDNELVSNNPLQGPSEFVDGGRTRHIGAEATAALRVGKGLALPFDLDLGAQYTFVQARFVGGKYPGKTVPYSPVNSANATLDLALPIGLSGQVAFGYIGSQYTDSDNTVEPGVAGLDGVIVAYTTLDVNARYRYAPSGVSFGLSAKSLLNRVYISDRLPNGIFTAGFRQIIATFAWSSDG